MVHVIPLSVDRRRVDSGDVVLFPADLPLGAQGRSDLGKAAELGLRDSHTEVTKLIPTPQHKPG